MSSTPYSLFQGSANYVQPILCFYQVLLEQSYGRQTPSHPCLLVFTSQYSPLSSTVGTTCYLFLTMQMWQRKWGVPPLVVALCKILLCHETYSRDFFPCWLGRSKWPYGEELWVTSRSWGQPAAGKQPRPSAGSPTATGNKSTNNTNELEVDSFPVKPADENVAPTDHDCSLVRFHGKDSDSWPTVIVR